MTMIVTKTATAPKAKLAGRRLLGIAALLLLTAVAGAFAAQGGRKQPDSDLCVAKSLADYEDAQYTSIQAAVNAAKPGQIIEILDTAVYEEQVTVDGRDVSPWDGNNQGPIKRVVGGKNGITIRYVPPGGARAFGNHARPTIKYKDTQNTSPKNGNEAKNFGDQVGQSGNFETCGALRILHAKDVTIEGIAVDGGGAYAFGVADVWGEGNDLAHGNAAVTLAIAGRITIRDCDIRNAFFGVYITDRNTGGVFGNPNPADNDQTVPLSGFGAVCGHLFEYNKVNNNVLGLFFESAWDIGSTVRYNLIYRNKKGNIPAASWNWVGIAVGQKNGGAFMFKDMYLSPIAIYNNTLYDNTGNFIGHWQSGGQHLIFNNIFSKSSPAEIVNGMSLDGAFPNRMHNNVFEEGTVGNGNTMNMTTLFKSLNATDAEFLVPDWSNATAVSFIKNKGWPAAGIRNNDGSMADLGAIPSTGVRQTTVARIIPTNVVTLSGEGANANTNFSLKIDNGTINNPKIKLLRWIAPIPENNTNSNSWPSNVTVVPQTAVRTVTNTSAVNVGNNSKSFTTGASTVPQYGFFEIIAEGTDANGNPVTSDIGFLPYRRLENFLDIKVFPAGATVATATGNGLDTVTAGTPYALYVSARQGNAAFGEAINSVAYSLLSDPAAFMYSVQGDRPLLEDAGKVFNPGQIYNVYFTRVGAETIMGAGVYDPAGVRSVFSGVKDITVKPGVPAKIVFKSPVPKSQLAGAPAAVINCGVDYEVRVEVQDKYGNAVDAAVPVVIKSLSPNKGNVAAPGVPITATSPTTATVTTPVGGNGIVTFTARVTGGLPRDEFDMAASFTAGGISREDIGRLRVGSSLDRLEIFYGDNQDGKNFNNYYDPSVVIDGNADVRYKVTVKAVGVDTVITSRTGQFVSVEATHTYLQFFSAATGGTAATVFPLTNGIATFYVSAPGAYSDIIGACIDVTALTNAAGDVDAGIRSGNRCGIYFVTPIIISVAAPVREIPWGKSAEEVVAVAPVNRLTAEFAAGPNPVGKSSGAVSFFRSGSRISSEARLAIYDAAGNVVKRVALRDGNAVGVGGKRKIGEWDLTDAKGRRVPEGTYLIKGAIKARDGKKEKVSTVVGVR